MKINVLKIVAIMLLLAGWFYSCDKESGDNVPYKPCPCEEGKSMKDTITYFPRTEALLVRDSIPDNLSDIMDLNHNLIGAHVFCIVYDSRTNVCGLYTTGHMSFGMWRICNFPDFVKEWDIPENGCKVFFTGMRYEPCEYIPQQSFGWDEFYFGSDFILTSLTKKLSYEKIDG